MVKIDFPHLKRKKFSKKIIFFVVMGFVFFISVLSSFKSSREHLRHTITNQQLEIQKLKDEIERKKQDKPEDSKNSSLNFLKAAQRKFETTVLPLYYAHSEAVVKLIEKHRGFISKRGHISAEARTNQLIITDKFSSIDNIKKIVQKIDTPLQQILIKAKIINIDEDSLEDLGIDLRTTSHFSNFQNSENYWMDFPEQKNNYNTFNIPIITLKKNRLIELKLTALEEEGRAKIISQPELLTSNHQTASIESGEEIPYQHQAGEGITSVAFKKAVLKLSVTPEIFPEHTVHLQIELNQDQVSELTINGSPAIHTEKLKTQANVRNNQTIILGGITTQSSTDEESRWPGLSRIPGLGSLFKHKKKQFRQKVLLIFITPSILAQ